MGKVRVMARGESTRFRPPADLPPTLRCSGPAAAAGLATRAVVAGPAGEADALDPGAAGAARLAGPAVDGEVVLEPAAQAGPADVVADGRAAVLDRPGEHRLDRLAEPVRLGERQRLALALRVQLRQEARLVGV